MKLVSGRSSVALWAAAFFFCLMLVAIVGARYVIQTETNTTSLTELGRKEYVDPGQLLYCKSGPQGIWTVHQLKSEVILSFTDSSGSKRWLTKYPATGLLLDTSKYFTAVGLPDGHVSVIDWQGLSVWQHAAQMPLLALKVNDQGEVIANFDAENDDKIGWGSILALLTGEGQVAWQHELASAQLVTAAWSDTTVAVITYKANQTQQGMELIVYAKTTGQELLKRYLGDQPVTGLSLNSTESKVLVAFPDSILLVDAASSQTRNIKQKRVVAALTASDEGFYLLVHKRLLWKHQTQVLYLSPQGTIRQIAELNGLPQSWEQGLDGRLLVVTDTMVYGLEPGVRTWQVVGELTPIDAAMDLLNGTVFVYTSGDVLLWYK